MSAIALRLCASHVVAVLLVSLIVSHCTAAGMRSAMMIVDLHIVFCLLHPFHLLLGCVFAHYSG